MSAGKGGKARSSRPGLRWSAALVGPGLLWGARAADACAVCYGAADSAMTAGMNNAILVLLVVVAVVQVGFVSLFLGLWRRARRLRAPSARCHLIERGAP